MDLSLCGHWTPNGVPVLFAFLPNHIASDLLWLSFNPLQPLNRSKNSNSFPSDNFSLQKEVVSSAYWDNFSSLFKTRIPFIWSLALIEEDSNSAAKINSKPDKGQPCLTPLSKVNGSEAKPLFKIQLEIFVRPVGWGVRGARTNPPPPLPRKVRSVAYSQIIWPA